MFHGDNTDNALWLNELNHNERKDPHPQYNLPIFKSQVMNVGQWVKIFDYDFYSYAGLNASQRTQGLQKLLMIAYVYGMDDDGNQQIGILTFMMIAKYNNTYNCQLSYTPYIDQVGDENTFKAYLTDKGSGVFNVQLYGTAKGSGSAIKIKPIIYDPVVWVNNILRPYTCVGYNAYEMVTDFFKDFSSYTPISSANLPTTYTKIIYDYEGLKKIPTRSVTFTSGNTIDVTNIDYVVLGSSTAATLNTLTGGVNGQEITLISWNENVTLASTAWNGGSVINDTMILKNETNFVLPRGKVMKLKRMYNVWFEITRSL